MAAKSTVATLDELAGIRSRIDTLRDDWDANHDVTRTIRQLDALSATCTAYPSIQALLYGAARVIEDGEPAGRRLEKLSDHLHGYVVGWEDGAARRTS